MLQSCFSSTRSGFLTVLSLALLPTPLPGQENLDLTPPAGPALTLDGTLATEEWKEAARGSLSGAGLALFMTRDGLLSVGVRGPAHGLAHLVVASGDTVRVLHASAALGTVVYVRRGGSWEKIVDPVWEMRDPSSSLAAIRARSDHLDIHGWVGTTGRMGRTNEVEFLLRPQAFGEGPLYLAVAFFPVDPQGAPLQWPGTTGDDVALIPLLTGPMPQTLHLAPERWGRLGFPQDPSKPATAESTL